MLRLKELRKEKGLTAEELAKNVGMSRSSIGMIETEKCGITSANALMFAKYFDCSVEYLLGQTDIRKAPNINVIASLKGDKLEIMSKINDLNDEQLHDLNLLIDLLYKKNK